MLEQGISFRSLSNADSNSTSAHNSDPREILASLNAPRFKVRYHDSPWFFPVDIKERITDLSAVIYQGLGALDGDFPESSVESRNWLIFDKNHLHVPTAEVLDHLPAGSELIFVPQSVARPPKNKST